MYCTNCGTENTGTGMHCVSCGEMLNASPAYAAQGPGFPAPNNLVWSILVTLFCCQPFGIVGIVYSALSMGHNTSGRFDEAHRTADLAKKWNWWGVIAWAIFAALYVVLMVVVGVAGGP